MQRNPIIIFCLLLTACSNQKIKEAEAGPEPLDSQVILTSQQRAQTDIVTGKAEKREMPHQLNTAGMMEAAPGKAYTVSMPTGGFVRSTQLAPGMYVKKGQTLAVMEDPLYIEIQQDYLEKKLQLKKAEIDFKRQKDLNENKASSDKTLQQAEMEYQALGIQLSALEEKLKLLNLQPSLLNTSNLSARIPLPAPTDGYVTRVLARPGRYANPSDVLFELTDPREALLHLKVFEKDVHLLRPGLKVMARPVQSDLETYAGKIFLINREVSGERTVDVYCTMEGNTENLLPGTNLNAMIETYKRSILGVPETAVVRHAGKEYLFISEGNERFTMTEVTTGKTTEGWTEILNSQAILEKELVIKGAYALLMSLKNKSDE